MSTEKFTINELEIILERLKSHMSLKNDYEIAELLDLSRNNFSQKKIR